MQILEREKDTSETETSTYERYDLVAANFTNLVSRKVVPIDEYTAGLVYLIDSYPTHFRQRRAELLLCSVGMIIRRDVDAIIGESCPLTVDEVGSIFTSFIRDDTSKELSDKKFSPISRAAALTLLHCIEQHPLPKVL